MSIAATARKIADRVRRDPAALSADGRALVRGTCIALFYRLFHRHVRIRLPFLAYSRVRICGPGSVFIDRWCAVHHNTFEGLSIATLSREATVRIGARCNLGGMTIRCRKSIEIGGRVLSANCLVQDTLFCGTPAGHGADAAVAEDVRIGDSVWVTAQTIVLGGSTIGEQCVLSLASVYYQFVVPDGHVAFGNPAFGSLAVGGLNRFLRNP